VRYEGKAASSRSGLLAFGLQPDDLSTGYGPPKWRYWEDTVDVPRARTETTFSPRRGPGAPG
jgi:hypothetical protein